MVRTAGFTSDLEEHFPKEDKVYEQQWVELSRPGGKNSYGQVIVIKEGYFHLLPFSYHGNDRGYRLVEDGPPEMVPIAGTAITPSSKEKVLSDMAIMNKRSLQKQEVEDLENIQKLKALEIISSTSQEIFFNGGGI